MNIRHCKWCNKQRPHKFYRYEHKTDVFICNCCTFVQATGNYPAWNWLRDKVRAGTGLIRSQR